MMDQAFSFGGAYWTRTSDPIDVNDVLYQLSQSTMGFRYLFRACFHNANRRALCTSASMFYRLSHGTMSLDDMGYDNTLRPPCQPLK